MDGLLEKLHSAGLTGNEAKVYLSLLRTGSRSANELSKQLSMDRTLIYSVLHQLMQKGLVNFVVKGKKKYFDNASPEHLLNPVMEKEAFIKMIIPQLKALEQRMPPKQEIIVYEGKEGVKTVLKEMMKYKNVSSFGGTGRAYDAFYEAPRLTKELTKKGFCARIIMGISQRSHALTRIHGVTVRFLDHSSDATTTIFGDNVSIHTMLDKPLIILIKSKVIAESYQQHFEVLWRVAKK